MGLPQFARPSFARSRNMAAIRSHDTRPEIDVHSAIHRAGFRFRLRPSSLPGRPDLVFPRFQVAVFVNGCFWHGHSCKIGHIPGSNHEYWTAKITRNIERDRRNLALLADHGWEALVLWECDLQDGICKLRETLTTKRQATEVKDHTATLTCKKTEPLTDG